MVPKLIRYSLVGAILNILFFIPPCFSGPKNFIVMISDGCGYGPIRATEFWNGHKQPYEHFPLVCAMSTYSQESLLIDSTGYSADSIAADFNYLLRRPTDSAAAATTMSTGVKTYNVAIGVNPGHQNLLHFSERCEALGMSTGVVTTVQFVHATPAGFVAHDVHRRNYREIALEILDSNACEVIIGKRNPFFDDDGNPIAEKDADYEFVGGKVAWDGLIGGKIGGDQDGDGDRDRWTVIESKEEFQYLATGDTPKRLCGIPKVHTTLQQKRSPLVGRNDPQAPFTTPFNKGVPTLTEMTAAALNVLDNDPDGFFVMIEGGAIDWANHANQIGRAIEEESDFNAAVGAVESWVEQNSSWEETILMITADHECGYLLGSKSDLGEPGAPPRYFDVGDKGAGQVPDFHYFSKDHTNSLVPFFAKGNGVEVLKLLADQHDPHRGRYLDNSEMGATLFRLLEGK